MVDPLGRARGILIVASTLILGMAGFFLAIFAGFGHWRIGLGIACAAGLGLIAPGRRYLQLRRAPGRDRRRQDGDRGDR